ncbi:MAG TPA: Sua5/YciO/YrdC/YwlC family protein [Longimicrobiales bacterium]|nr:Sua5/YciO/YrdC/YwlC family protein [Longimicrobiales bacterium]
MTRWRRLPDGEEGIAGASEALARDGILAHPTATVYGLGAGTPAGDDRVRRLKGMDEERPLLRLAADAATLRACHPGLRWTEEAERLAGAFWPGPLTLVLDDGGPTGLGVRVEGHPETRAVLAAWGRTMSSTSLNRTGQAPAATADRARTALDRLPETDGEPVRWLDAGDLPGSPPSTVLSLREGEPRILRAGAVGGDRLAAALGRELVGG